MSMFQRERMRKGKHTDKEMREKGIGEIEKNERERWAGFVGWSSIWYFCLAIVWGSICLGYLLQICWLMAGWSCDDGCCCPTRENRERVVAGGGVGLVVVVWGRWWLVVL
ncbi:hypothetical protein HanIR_Chr10g0477751 [Helianthus annuus]|nr:hypothetical protein HanIR_Chr10g0477751 [Helianthus annuus]